MRFKVLAWDLGLCLQVCHAIWPCPAVVASAFSPGPVVPGFYLPLNDLFVSAESLALTGKEDGGPAAMQGNSLAATCVSLRAMPRMPLLLNKGHMKTRRAASSLQFVTNRSPDAQAA